MIFSMIAISFMSSTSWAAPHSPLTDQLTDEWMSVRKQVAGVERDLIEGMKSKKNIRSQIRKIQQLVKLQKTEHKLAQQQMSEFEKKVKELEDHQLALKEKIALRKGNVKKCLRALEASEKGEYGKSRPLSIHLQEQEKIEAPRRLVLARLSQRGLQDLKALRMDLNESGVLEEKIQNEKQQLAYLIQDLKERESVLELNQQLQIDIFKKKQNPDLTRLENYHRMKRDESRVEFLMSQFNAKKELEHATETEKEISRIGTTPSFSLQKGKLPYPVLGGRIVSKFGRTFDSSSGLFVFKKGIDISIGKNEPVRAISSGKVAFSGELPNYGQVVIIDHGEHFYTLCAHLGSVSKRLSDSVSAGDQIGSTGNSENPLYFEIRSKNVAVNPLQWLFN